MSQFQQRADTVYQQLIDLEAKASDDQLFLCSYLLGHISLVSANSGDSAKEFELQVENSLHEAYKVDSLTDQDISDINSLWQQLIAS